MKNNWITNFGVEIHAELKTNTKAFSPAKINLNSSPNTMIHQNDFGYPGTKPTVNKKMVEYSYRLAKILKMKIEKTLFFDRKSYFYPDLPKGFQITQYFNPIGKNGKFKIYVNEIEKEISITEIHMEEDTGKQIKTNEGILFDFNRCGVPLIEIVSGHKELSSIDDVISYVKQLREQLIIMGICDGKMEKGSFRVDINVSIRKENNDIFGTRTEIKNFNSFKNIKLALEKEIKRHIELYENNKKIISQTVRFDEEEKKIIPMREKDNLQDYNYIPEGNINPINLTNEIINEFNLKSKNDISVFDFRKNFNKKITNDSISIILDNKNIFDLFNQLLLNLEINKTVNFIINDFKPLLNDNKIESFRFDCEEILKLIDLRKNGKINNKKYSELIISSFSKKILHDLDKIDNLKLMNDDEITKILNLIIKKNKEIILKDIHTRPERVEKFLMGQLMKETKGKASPQNSIKLVKKIIWEKQN